MLRILKSPVRLPIPDRPEPAALEQYRDRTIARVRARCAALRARRARLAVAEHMAQVVEAEVELREVSESVADHPIEQLCASAGVGSAGVEVLGLIVAPSFDATVRTAYGELQSDLHVGIDREVVRDLVGDSISDHLLAELLGDGGVFERLGLIEASRTATGRELVMPTARLLSCFNGELASDPRLVRLVQWRECRLDDAVGVISEDDYAIVVDLMACATQSSTPPLLLVIGVAGTGRMRLAQTVAAGLGLRWVAAIEAALLPREGAEIATALERAERDARFLRGMLVLRGIDQVDASRRRVLASVLSRVTVPIVVTTSEDDVGEIEKLVAARYIVRRPAASLRHAAWSAELASIGGTLANEQIERLSEDYPLTRSAIARAVELAHARDPSLSEGTLRWAAGSQVHSHLERYAKRIVSRTHLDDLVLAEDLRQQIDELLRAARTRPELDQVMSGRPIGPNGVAALFNGPSGTGKTLTASAMASALGLPMYKIDVSSIVDRYVGETEKNLARIFEEAESERGLLLFDEADSLFTKRVEVSDSHDRYANMQVNMLLNLIDDYSGLVVLTTNLKASIDTAFMRRMSFKLTFDLPDAEQREALWRLHIPPEIPLARDVNLADLAERFRASGGEIRNAVYRALLMTTPGAPLDREVLSRAMARELEASGNVVKR